MAQVGVVAEQDEDVGSMLGPSTVITAQPRRIRQTATAAAVATSAVAVVVRALAEGNGT